MQLTMFDDFFQDFVNVWLLAPYPSLAVSEKSAVKRNEQTDLRVTPDSTRMFRGIDG